MINNMIEKVRKAVRVFTARASEATQEREIKLVNSNSTGKQYRDIRKPFISKSNHDKLVKVSKFFGYYYETKRGVVFMNKKPHKIIILKDKIYLQYNNNPFVSVEAKLNSIESINNITPQNMIDKLSAFSGRYSQTLENVKNESN